MEVCPPIRPTVPPCNPQRGASYPVPAVRTARCGINGCQVIIDFSFSQRIKEECCVEYMVVGKVITSYKVGWSTRKGNYELQG